MSLAVRLYRILQPVLGHPLRVVAHAARRRFTGDTSQLGEALTARGQVRPGWPEWVVEVGANDGITNSNSRLFVKCGWSALLIEPNPHIFKKLESSIARFPEAKALQMACAPEPGTVSLEIYADDPTGQLSKIGENAVRGPDGKDLAETVEVEADTLTAILDRNGVPEDFGLLSVDTEGLDLQIFRTLDFARYRPRLIITETDEEEETEQAKRTLLSGAGYEIFEEVGVNTLWRCPKKV